LGAPLVTLALRRLRGISLPDGTVSIGVGLLVAGLAQYGFLAIAARSLGPVRYAPLATFWSLLFVVGPGFFLPLELEVSRALAARLARGDGGRPLVLRAAAGGGAVLVVLVVGSAIASGPIDRRLFNNDPIMVWALIAGLGAYYVEHLTRGTLAGNSHFRGYGLLVGGEGVLRVLLCTVLALLGATIAGWFGFAVVVGSLMAVGVALAGRRGLLLPGPPASWGELSRALGYLLMSSVLSLLLLNGGTVAVQLLATPGQEAAAGRFLTARIIAFMPVYLFQAVPAALLPKLSRLAAEGRMAEFRKVILELTVLVGLLGTSGVGMLTAFGPAASHLLFGGAFDVGLLDYALLSASGAVVMVGTVLYQSLVALSGYERATAGILVGTVSFVLVTAIGSQLFLRVELGLLAGAIASSAVMAALLIFLIRTRSRLQTEQRSATAPSA
jgi:O-antigen/teichoic acid export membrane protein